MEEAKAKQILESIDQRKRESNYHKEEAGRPGTEPKDLETQAQIYSLVEA